MTSKDISSLPSAPLSTRRSQWARASAEPVRRRVRHAVAIMGTGLCALAVTSAQESAPAGTAPGASPLKLVVMISVDQLIPEQLERLRPELTGGLHRLATRGTVYRDARLPYARTETGAGHVTMSTGCIPRTHGVVGNGFWDRTLGREQYCVEDQEASAIRTVGEVKGSGKRSPRNILRPTLGEMLQAKTPGSKVVSISSKDRAAIGMAGRSKGHVWFWDKNGSGFQSSNFYCDGLPSYVSQWNEGWLSQYKGWTWSPMMGHSAEDLARLGTAADDRDGERPLLGDRITFPYAFPATALPKAMGGLAYTSPLTDQFVAELAREAVTRESLGADGDVDLLCVSFSGCDVVGHSFGPYSCEVTDLLFRLDRQLGLLFDQLDATVGEGAWIASLTADHGVLPLPEHLAARGVAARRVEPTENSAFRGDLVAKLSEACGGRVRHKTGPSGFVLDAKDLAALGLDPAQARATAAATIRGMRGDYDWIETAYSVEEIAAFGPDVTGIEAMLRNSYYPDRTIDVVIIYRAGVLVGLSKGTSHGSPHDYDRHVPMILLGAPFASGTSSRPVGSQDIVPTVLGALGIEATGDLDGENLLN